MKIYLYGPPGSGKSTTGRLVAERLDLPFYDLDQEIESRQGMSIPEIFAGQGEAGFRRCESLELRREREDACVIALGGGALLDEENRAWAEASGQVICLDADLLTLLHRLEAEQRGRPLLAQDPAAQLANLLAARGEHYASFPGQLNTTCLSPEEAAWQAQVRLGRFRLKGMGKPYDVLIRDGLLDDLGKLMKERGLRGPVALVSDEHVAPLYADQAARSLEAAEIACRAIIVLPPGEQHKMIETVAHLWEGFLAAGLDRASTVVTLGGGVVTDLAGFAAGTYLRGVSWAAVPTSLLGMVDASLGGKTGADLPQGKNLIGLFHPPRLVLTDPALLETLPKDELRSGMAEALKHGLIGDRELFERCAAGWGALEDSHGRIGAEELVRRAVAVKIRVLLADPYEQGQREVLNLGHTVGHALERASSYRISHGEAVAIGLVVEAHLAETLGLAEPGLSGVIEGALAAFDLPLRIPGSLEEESLRQGLRVDKKRRAGRARLALPVKVGEARYGIEVDEEEIWSQCLSCMDRT